MISVCMDHCLFGTSYHAIAFQLFCRHQQQQLLMQLVTRWLLPLSIHLEMLVALLGNFGDIFYAISCLTSCNCDLTCLIYNNYGRLLSIAEEILAAFLSKAMGTAVDWVQMPGMKVLITFIPFP